MTTYRIPVQALTLVRERTITVASKDAKSAADVAAIAHAMIGDSPVEKLLAIMVNGRNQVTAIVVLAQGGISAVSASTRDVLRPVLTHQASAFILAHNHPSGDSTPSGDDYLFTRAIQKAADVVGVPLLDHVIVTSDGSFSSVT